MKNNKENKLKNKKNPKEFFYKFLNQFKLFLKEHASLLFYNARPLIIFELLYKVISLIVAGPLIWWLLDTTMKLAGFKYLTQDNYIQFLSSPIFVISIVFLLIIVALYSMIDISAAIFVFECSRQKKHTTVIDVLKFSFKNAIRILQPKNIPLILVVVVLLPIVGLGTTSAFTQNFNASFIMVDSFSENLWIALIFVIVFLFMIWLVCRWMFTLQYFTIEQENFFTSVKKSARLNRGHKIKNIIAILFVQVIILLVNYLMSLGSTALSSVVLGLFGRGSIAACIFLAIVFVLFMFLYAVVFALFTPITTLRMNVLFYYDKKSAHEELKPFKYSEPPKKKNSIQKFAITLVVVGIIITACIASSFLSYFNGGVSLQIEGAKQTEITADGAISYSFEENYTKEIEAATKIGANYILITTQATKDNQIILVHESYFERKQGSGNSISDFSYEELMSTNGTTRKMSNISEEKSPPLTQAIQHANSEGIGLVIDISNLNNKETSLDSLINCLKDSNLEYRCIVASNQYDDLKVIKYSLPNVKTVYKLGIAFGDLSEYDSADAVAIDSVSLSASNVTQFHTAGKEVFAWKIHDKKNLENAISIGVDNIVTIDTYRAVSLASRKGTPEFAVNIYDSIKND